jgi:ATP/maltotriose-dependent transcriptional regulator MalT
VTQQRRPESELTTPLLTTKLHIPPNPPELVPRPRLIERLNAGLASQSGFGETQGFARKLTLISPPRRLRQDYPAQQLAPPI